VNISPRSLSLVIPAYEEIAALPALRTALETWVPQQNFQTEVIIVNDGSKDGTAEFLNQWADASPWLHVLHFSRNFGHQAAITAGLDVANTDVTVIIDADLQDPLDAIPGMIKKYEEGFDVVYGKRSERLGEGPFKKITAWFFYRLMQTLVYRDLPSDTGDFRLVSRQCLEAIRSMRETHRFLRGMFSWAGFKQTAYPYVRQQRKAGETKYPFKKMCLFAWNAVISFSPLPLRLILLLGLVVAGFGTLYGVYSTLRWALVGDTVAGWPTLVVLICMIGGSILIALGVMGEYISRIYEELKGRPLYIIAGRRNI